METERGRIKQMERELERARSKAKMLVAVVGAIVIMHCLKFLT